MFKRKERAIVLHMIDTPSPGKKILVVEDEAALRETLAKKLSSEGFNVLRAADGEHGLALAFDEHPDLILLDILMPKVDGVAVAKKLRADDWGKDVPIIIMTNLSGMNKVEEVKEIGITEYLVKSNVDLATVVQKVQKYLAD